VALGHLGVAVSVSALRLLIASRILQLDFVSALRQFVPSLAGSALMGVAAWSALRAADSWAQASAIGGLAALSATVAVGGAVYIAALWWLERDLVRQGLRVALSVVRR